MILRLFQGKGVIRRGIFPSMFRIGLAGRCPQELFPQVAAPEHEDPPLVIGDMPVLDIQKRLLCAARPEEPPFGPVKVIRPSQNSPAIFVLSLV
ncbi:MAG: hypothetical protein LBT95_06600 [Treponema sp.]|jgi:hypothetical protein|nr:hypothetical protein [Treponema sp.]